MEKVIRNGKVAVLYSRGYGAGWYSWNYDEKWNKGLLFNPTLVDMVENERHNEITEELVKSLLNIPEEDHVCVLGSYSLDIEWIPEGMAFKVNEYDGAESIETIEDLPLIA